MTKSPGALARQLDAPVPVEPRWLAPMAAALLTVVTIVSYLPGLSGGFIWDDPDYVVNNPTLRSVHGLWTMWTNTFSLPQWYPLVHTTYWLEFQLYRAAGLGETPGLWAMGYKITNLLLHITTALLLWRLLARLAVPGAYLAALVFALHPVHVESVTWITERKNTLSGLFYVMALLAYLRSCGWWTVGRGSETDAFNDLRPTTHNPRLYTLALVLFACALLSKTVTATLPAAILVLTWWKLGRIGWRRDVMPLIPFFVLGAAMGSITAYLERHHVGAVGAEWDHAPTALGEFASRTLIAGRAVWFYFGKLLWPVDLAFMYERWTIDMRSLAAWVFPIAAVVVLIVLLLARRRIGRGPLAAPLLFGGTLFPALGYFNVYPHRYSFVADHFQHLASISVTTLVCAMIAMALRRQKIAMIVFGGLIAAALAGLTLRQTRIYESKLTLWADTTIKSPRQWVGWTNLGKELHDAGKTEASIAAHDEALRLAPHIGDTWFNIATINASRQRFDEAERGFAKAIELAYANRPGSAVELDALIALSRIAVGQRGDFSAAEAHLLRARELRPEYPLTDFYLAALRERQGRIEEAFDLYVTATERMPAHFDSHLNLGLLLIRLNQLSAASDVLQTAVRIDSGNASAWTNLGSAELMLGRRERAKQAFERALAIDPTLEPARRGLAAVGGGT